MAPGKGRFSSLQQGPSAVSSGRGIALTGSGLADRRNGVCQCQGPSDRPNILWGGTFWNIIHCHFFGAPVASSRRYASTRCLPDLMHDMTRTCESLHRLQPHRLHPTTPPSAMSTNLILHPLPGSSSSRTNDILPPLWCSCPNSLLILLSGTPWTGAHM